METRAPYALIGFLVVLAIGAVFGFVYWMHIIGGLGDRALYRVRFENSVSGVLIGSAVMFNGIKVGEVTELKRKSQSGLGHNLRDDRDARACRYAGEPRHREPDGHRGRFPDRWQARRAAPEIDGWTATAANRGPAGVAINDTGSAHSVAAGRYHPCKQCGHPARHS